MPAVMADSSAAVYASDMLVDRMYRVSLSCGTSSTFSQSAPAPAPIVQTVYVPSPSAGRNFEMVVGGMAASSTRMCA